MNKHSVSPPTSPQVSIGLPVYNGENYLAEAIESVLAQSYRDFELIICDNASTDETAAISQHYAEADSRIRYYRNVDNIGAAANYDRVWELSRGIYFKWFAHDDRLLPTYLETAVAMLDAHPDAVLCNSIADYIDDNGDHLGYYRSIIRDYGASADPSVRFAGFILRLHTCVDFFGLIRRQAMVDSLLHQAYRGSDRAFLAQMALRGRLLQIDQPLTQMRQHAQQYSQINNLSEQLSWMHPERKGQRELSVLRLYRVYRDLVENECLSEQQRRACRTVLRRFWLQSWPLPRLAAEMLSIPFPGTASFVRKLALKLRLAGAPQDYLANGTEKP